MRASQTKHYLYAVAMKVDPMVQVMSQLAMFTTTVDSLAFVVTSWLCKYVTSGDAVLFPNPSVRAFVPPTSQATYDDSKG